MTQSTGHGAAYTGFPGAAKRAEPLFGLSNHWDSVAPAASSATLSRYPRRAP